MRERVMVVRGNGVVAAAVEREVIARYGSTAYDHGFSTHPFPDNKAYFNSWEVKGGGTLRTVVRNDWQGVV